MKKNSLLQGIRVVQLLVAGAIVGLYVARAIGWTGVEITPTFETVGASLGAGGVLGLKLLHLV